MRGRIKTTAAAAVLVLAGCISPAQLEEARAEEARAESLIESIEALPANTPGRADLLADALQAEATLEAQRKALEKLTQDGLIATGVDAASDAATGDYIGAVEALLAALGATAVVYLRKKQRVDLEELERRRDESRQLQGIEAARARSAIQTSSPAARAAAAATRPPQVLPPATQSAPTVSSAATSAPGPATPLAAPAVAPAATYYGDPNRFPSTPLAEMPQ